MTLLAQQGYAKARKIEDGLRTGAIQGAILSPRHEKPEKLREYVAKLRAQSADAEILIDPQFYATMMSSDRLGYLPLYDGYFRPGLGRRDFIGQAKLGSYVAGALGFQKDLAVSRLVSPSILLNTFSDDRSQIAFALAEESLNYHEKQIDAPPLLLTLVVNEAALHDTEGLFEFLDLVASWDVHGFYVLVARSTSTYPAPFAPPALANLMYLAHVLGEVNKREVIFGYSDLVGLLLTAAGATALGTGWWNTTRQFCTNMFEESTGGQRPKARYTSRPLLSSILLIPELVNAVGALSAERILSHTEEDDRLRPGISDENWPPDVACLHHWRVISDVLATLERLAPSERIELLDQNVRSAYRLHNELRQLGVQFESAAGRSQIAEWIQAIDIFSSGLLGS